MKAPSYLDTSQSQGFRLQPSPIAASEEFRLDLLSVVIDAGNIMMAGEV